MKKKLRKNLAMVLTFFMMLSLIAVPAFAAEPAADVGTAVCCYDFEVPAYGDAESDAPIFILPAGQLLYILDSSGDRLYVETTADTAITRVWIEKEPFGPTLSVPAAQASYDIPVYASPEDTIPIFTIEAGTPYFITGEIGTMLFVEAVSRTAVAKGLINP